MFLRRKVIHMFFPNSGSYRVPFGEKIRGKNNDNKHLHWKSGPSSSGRVRGARRLKVNLTIISRKPAEKHLVYFCRFYSEKFRSRREARGGTQKEVGTSGRLAEVHKKKIACGAHIY